MTLAADFAEFSSIGGGALTGCALAGEAGLALLAGPSSGTPFQRADWVRAYLDGHGIAPDFRLLVIEAAGGRQGLPVLIRRHAGWVSADFVGGKHASFRAPRQSGRSEDWSAAQWLQALRQAGRAAGIDALTLRDCPEEVLGSANPLRALRRWPSPSAAARLTLVPDEAAVIARISSKEDQRKLRGKARKLSEFGPLRAAWAREPAEIAATLDQLLEWKAARFATLGIRDPFRSGEIRQFLRQACAGDTPAIRIFALHAGERPVAAIMGAVGDGQFSAMANANALDAAILRSSPGYLLIMALLRTLVAEGFTSFDLGVGEAGYKEHFCPEPVPLFDAVLPISPAGRLAAAVFEIARRGKGAIKGNARAMALVERLRRLRAARS